MDLVVDANIIFAALIKESLSFHLLFDERFHLFTPEYVFIEFEKHKDELLEKTERREEDFFRVLETFKRRIILVPLEELTTYISKAEKITPDPDDMVYFALALKYNCPIWSNDKGLKQQKEVKIFHTHELIKTKITGFEH